MNGCEGVLGQDSSSGLPDQTLGVRFGVHEKAPGFEWWEGAAWGRISLTCPFSVPNTKGFGDVMSLFLGISKHHRFTISVSSLVVFRENGDAAVPLDGPLTV